MACVRREYFVGLDLGQKHDFTALCVVERAEETFDVREPVSYQFLRETRLSVRHLERVRLRTPYPDVVDRVKAVVMDPALDGRRTLVVDATGVGAPVVDLLCACGLDCEIVPVMITGGASSNGAGGERRVSKQDLITGLQLMFDLGELQIARGLAETATLRNELRGMRVKMSAAGHDSYGSGGRAAHDDLVLAVALACWRAKGPGKWNWFGGRPDGRG